MNHASGLDKQKIGGAPDLWNAILNFELSHTFALRVICGVTPSDYLILLQCAGYMSPPRNATAFGAKTVPKTRLTDIGLLNLKSGATDIDYWDAKLPTFGVRVSPKGTKTFVLKIHNGRQAIGRYPLISLSEARTEAKRILAEKTLGRIRSQSITYPQAFGLATR